jgi:hypothetical protein
VPGPAESQTPGKGSPGHLEGTIQAPDPLPNILSHGAVFDPCRHGSRSEQRLRLGFRAVGQFRPRGDQRQPRGLLTDETQRRRAFLSGMPPPWTHSSLSHHDRSGPESPQASPWKGPVRRARERATSPFVSPALGNGRAALEFGTRRVRGGRAVAVLDPALDGSARESDSKSVESGILGAISEAGGPDSVQTHNPAPICESSIDDM